VRAAELSVESAELDARYTDAKSKSEREGFNQVLDDFESEVLTKSAPVIARSANELQRLVTSDNELYSTYYKLIEAGVRLPAGSKWDVLRALVDTALFPNYKEHIRFAALSLDGVGLSNYGECSIELRPDMIAHRATVFEENSIIFMKKRGIKVWEAHQLPRGFRATWDARGKLCVAKLHQEIASIKQSDDYSVLLLRQGLTSEEDEFVEVHIWGPMTMHTVSRVTVSPGIGSSERGTIMAAVTERLARAGVAVRS
jgi:hypothetical protein